jgi:hypothetical protein
MHRNILVHTKFSIVRCRLSSACVILACVVCTRIIMAHVVCAVLSEHRGILLVTAHYGYMLSHANLISGAREVLVHSGGLLNFGMVQHVE